MVVGDADEREQAEAIDKITKMYVERDESVDAMVERIENDFFGDN